MNNVSNAQSIATPAQYRAAILAVRQRMTPVQLSLLQAHCRSAEHASSTGRLSELLNLPTAASANTSYRNYARWIADELKVAPNDSRGNPCWMLAVAYGRDDEGKIDSDYEWVMRPELVETLQAMKWA